MIRNVIPANLPLDEKRDLLKQELEAHARMVLNLDPEEPLPPPTMDFVRTDQQKITLVEEESSFLNDQTPPTPSYFGANGYVPVANEEPLLPPELDFGQRA